MFVGVARFDIHLLDQPNSLKAKRSTLRRIRDRIQQRLRLSVAEVGHQDLWQRSVFGVASVSPDQTTARRLLDQAAELIASEPNVEIVSEDYDVSAW